MNKNHLNIVNIFLNAILRTSQFTQPKIFTKEIF